ncbi:MAG: hypothetical protein LBR19_08670, partial [Bifidobacteriaceae bacterium]|nr:hypothetical protein [Bifidobacteriaceae bacterium]
ALDFTGYSATHTVCVKTKDAIGQESAPACKTEATGAAPAPAKRLWVTKGSTGGEAGTWWVVLNTQSYPAGTYKVTCHGKRSGSDMTVSLGSVKLKANGSVTLNCYYGSGRDVWATVGSDTSEHKTF